MPRELIGKSRAVVDFPSASASPSPPPHLPLTSPCASPSLPPPPHLHLPSHLCPPVRPAKSRRPWGRSGVGQRRWGAPGSLFPSDRLQSRVRRGPARGGIGSPGSALCCAAGTPPPPGASFRRDRGSRLAEEGGGLPGFGEFWKRGESFTAPSPVSPTREVRESPAPGVLASAQWVASGTCQDPPVPRK